MAPLLFALACVVVTILAALVVSRIPARSASVSYRPAPAAATTDDAHDEAEARAEAEAEAQAGAKTGV